MSTKIYNGYKLKLTNLYDIHDFCIRVRDQFRKEVEELFKEVFVEFAVDALDCVNNNFKSEKLKKNTPLTNAAFEIMQLRSENEKNRSFDSKINYNINWTIIPVKNKDYSLVLFYCEQNIITKLWENLPEIEYYGFWDNTDKDDKISDEEWGQREEDWSHMGWEAPICYGFSFDIFGKYGQPLFFTAEKINQELIEKACNNKNRAYLIIEDKLLNRYKEEIKIKNIPEDDFLNFRSKAFKWARENINIIQEIKDNLNLPLYTIEDLQPNKNNENKRNSN